MVALVLLSLVVVVVVLDVVVVVNVVVDVVLVVVVVDDDVSVVVEWLCGDWDLKEVFTSFFSTAVVVKWA